MWCSLSDYVSHRSRDARWVGVVLQLDRGGQLSQQEISYRFAGRPGGGGVSPGCPVGTRGGVEALNRCCDVVLSSGIELMFNTLVLPAR
jgi:hypothetical protein